MKLRKIETIAREMMDEHFLYDYKFEWMNSVRTFGNCNGYRKIIRLSIPLTKYETNNERIINTILHEIAHAIDYNTRGRSGHDATWKRIAKSIGCSGERCSSSSGVDKSKFMKWVVKCTSCDSTHYRARNTKKVSACSKCCNKHNNGNYSDDYKFKWVLNKKRC